ncbi:MAG: enoyl-CoA hydratase/isomerase family protein, partial [Myxococcota bacterium]|nr:enoyl-CoA hydratase/isomerase family protein [Myxococcota bacterium]
MSSELRYEKKSDIAVFTIDNPPVNAWTPSMHKAFYDRLVEFIDDDSVRVGILTGAGERCFSAGDDIKTPRPPRTHSELNRRY